jgi:hypothetical protein
MRQERRSTEKLVKTQLLLAAAGAAVVLNAPPSAAQSLFGGPDGPGRGRVGLAILQAADADGDHSVSRAELEAIAMEEFTWRDRNGDGALDTADASPVVQRLAAIRAADGDEPRSGRARRTRADADEDGRVTAAEFMDAETRVFERLDADSDGVITPAELDEQADARRNRGRWWRGP